RGCKGGHTYGRCPCHANPRGTEGLQAFCDRLPVARACTVSALTQLAAVARRRRLPEPCGRAHRHWQALRGGHGQEPEPFAGVNDVSVPHLRPSCARRRFGRAVPAGERVLPRTALAARRATA